MDNNYWSFSQGGGGGGGGGGGAFSHKIDILSLQGRSAIIIHDNHNT